MSKKGSSKSSVGGASTMTVANDNRKMGVFKYLSLYPKDIYISNLLKQLYPKKIQSKTDWDKTVSDLLKTNIK